MKLLLIFPVLLFTYWYKNSKSKTDKAMQYPFIFIAMKIHVMAS